MNGFYVHTIGCKVNRVESDVITAELLERGATAVECAKAQLVVVNTCTVTAEADAKTRKAIRRAHASASEPWVLVTGCSAALRAEELAALGERVIVEPDRQRALECARELLLDNDTGQSMQHTPLSASSDSRKPVLRIGSEFNTRLGIKIQDGCNHRCSYCIVSIARGPARSVAASTVLEEVARLAQAGARELILTGINLGTYCDVNADSRYIAYCDGDVAFNLAALLRACLVLAPTTRFRLSSLEPLDATDELLELIQASAGRICAHLHLPLQSGSDRILRLMRRPYTSVQFEHIIHTAKTLLPHCAFSTDVIVGFPGETDEDFAHTLALCERVAFSKIHVFRYSKRPGTEAAEMPGHISGAIKIERAQELSALATRLASTQAANRVGTRELVLVEHDTRGTSESYHRVVLKACHKHGSLVPVTFSASSGDALIE